MPVCSALPPARAVRRRGGRALGAWAMAAWLCGAAAAADLPQVVTVEGPPFQAILHSVTADGACEFASPESVRRLPLDDFVSFGAPIEPRTGSLTVLFDGSLVAGDVQGVRDDALLLQNDDLGDLSVPLERVRGVVLRLPTLDRRRDALIDRVLFSSGQSDRLLMENGDEIEGRLRSLESRNLRFEAPVGPLELQLDAVAAILLDPSLAPTERSAATLTLVGLRDGSLLHCDEYTQSDLLARPRVAGCPAWQVERRAVTYVAPHGRRVAYLSQLEPAGYRHVPFLNLEWNYRLDRSAAGGWLRAGGQWHPRGIGMHTASRLTFQIEPGYKRFEAAAALDDQVGRGGSVVFRVFIDNQQRLATETIRGGDPPTPISIDCSDGQTVSLVVDFADRGDQLDHAVWLDARLVK